MIVAALLTAGHCEVFGQGNPIAMRISNSIPDQGFMVENFSSPNFSSRAKQMLGPENWAISQKVLPYMLLLTNNTSRYIWGFTTIYKFPDLIAPAGTPWTVLNRITVGGVAERRLMIGPGDVYLVGPVSGLESFKRESGQIVPPPVPDDEFSRYVDSFVRQFLGGRVEVSVDAVVFEDGFIEGDDNGNLLGNTNAQVQAEKDLVDAGRNVAGAQLRDALARLAANKSRDVYFEHQARVAGELLEIFDKLGEATVRQAIDARRLGKWFNGADVISREDK